MGEFLKLLYLRKDTRSGLAWIGFVQEPAMVFGGLRQRLSHALVTANVRGACDGSTDNGKKEWRREA